MRAMYAPQSPKKSLLRDMLRRANENALERAFERMLLVTPSWARTAPMAPIWCYRKEWFFDYLVNEGVKNADAARYSQIEAHYRQHLAELHDEDRVADSRLEFWLKDTGELGWAIGALKLAT